MSKKNIVFISGYNYEEKNINGYMQLFNEYEKKHDFNVKFFKVDKVWFKSELKNYFKNNIKIYFPFSKYDIKGILRKFLISIPKVNYHVDVLFFDSDPYSILIHDEIIKHFKPKYIIYRQSDPMVLIDDKGILSNYEISLMNKSNQIWVTNVPRKNEIQNFTSSELLILENPIKLDLETIFNKEKSLWLKKIITLKDKYDNVGIYYGKLSIDEPLVIDLAARTKNTAYIIIGDYKQNKDYTDNVIVVPFMNMDEISEILKISDFMFVPYKINKNNELLHLTSKLLLASYYKKPIIMQGVNKSLEELDMYVGNGSEYFIEKINNLEQLKISKIDFKDYTEDTFYNNSKKYLDKLNAI